MEYFSHRIGWAYPRLGCSTCSATTHRVQRDLCKTIKMWPNPPNYVCFWICYNNLRATTEYENPTSRDGYCKHPLALRRLRHKSARMAIVVEFWGQCPGNWQSSRSSSTAKRHHSKRRCTDVKLPFTSIKLQNRSWEVLDGLHDMGAMRAAPTNGTGPTTFNLI